jgi:hypothetical protein
MRLMFHLFKEQKLKYKYYELNNNKIVVGEK